ncbi:MAG: protein translocase subunit SecD [Pseudomonadota bacterium]
MLQFTPLQRIAIAATIVLGILFAVPNFTPRESWDALPAVVPKTRVTLGLDLQGGSYILLRADTETVLSDRLNNTAGDIRAELRGRNGGDRLNFSDLTIGEDAISLRLESEADAEAAVERLGRLFRPQIAAVSASVREAVVSREGAVVTVTQTPEYRAQTADAAVSASIEAIRNRIDALGTREPTIVRQGIDRIVVEAPGDEDPEGLKEILSRAGRLTFHEHDRTVPIDQALAGRVPPGSKVFEADEAAEPFILLRETPLITGDMVKSASSGLNTDGGGFQINFAFDSVGARRFARYTRENIGRRFAIVLDDQVISAPTIQSAITGGSGRITGNFSPAEAERIAVLIQSGALPAPLQVINQRTIGPGLGADSIRAGTISLVVGFVAVIIFMPLCYGRFGLYADAALIANVMLLAGALSLLGATLTLPGIAGIVLTVGMAVDANVLIFERIREELREGRGAVQAVETGYQKAFSAILDANITTFISAFIMFFLGAGPVRGFAVTLAIGVITSVFTAYVLTRVFAGGFVLKARPKALAL